MILLNGVPPIIGMGLFHVTIINLIAIVVEYSFIKRRYNINKLALRTILANLTSLVAGLFVLVLLPHAMGGNIMRTDSPMTSFDRISLVAGLIGLFLANVVIEYPAYIVGIKTNRLIIAVPFKTVLIANLLTNIPVFILYGLLAL